MPKPSAHPAIRLRGVRQNNLKNFDLDLPLKRLIVITGLSGSGKSSLAFDTLFAEGQRRYIETFSPYARQFFDRMDKPRVDAIEGIPPAIAIEQRNSVRTTRSTVGTMTEICDYMKTLWPHLAELHCRQCGRLVRPEPPQEIWARLQAKSAEGGSADAAASAEMLVTFDLPLTEKLALTESLALVAKQGYQRLVVATQIVRLEEASPLLAARKPASLTVVQDRVRPIAKNRARFIEACEQAYHFGKGKLTLWEINASGALVNPHKFSNRRHCATCEIDYQEPSPALFSFNHPVGACPKCRGFGRIITIDYERALPDRSKTLAEGVVRPWQTGMSAECQRDLLRMCRHFEIPTNVPFAELPEKWQRMVIDGEPDYGKDEEHQWPRAWYGVKGYFRWLESKAYKMHVRVLLSRYRAYVTCPDCQGRRFQPESLLYQIPVPRGAAPGTRGATLSDFYQLPLRDAVAFLQTWLPARANQPRDPVALALNEVRTRLAYLQDVGLGYLTLDRPTRSLSGGETERVNLTTCLGTRLVNTLFVLDEPSVGLHPRDTRRLTSILQRLRDAGNTVVVVEHEASVMRAADQIVDLGPGHGATGGEIVFQGSYKDILTSEVSLTGAYLSGRQRIESRQPRKELLSAPRPEVLQSRAATVEVLQLNDRPAPFQNGLTRGAVLRITNATLHNLRNLSIDIPLGKFVCVTGVSGSGKSTLVREILLPALETRFQAVNQTGSTDGGESSVPARGDSAEQDEENAESAGPASASVSGWESLGGVVLVDQSSLGKTPRSNPAVYIGAFDDLREFFAQTPEAKARKFDASAFSFNSRRGQCERCRGAGFEKIEMQFLSDVFIRCPDCDGRRYRSHILEVKARPALTEDSTADARKRTGGFGSGGASIADLLDATVEEAIEFLAAFPEARSARRAAASLGLLREVGLGYLKLGQPINTLSGGESQRLKLVRHLADVEAKRGDAGGGEKPMLFLFDEPTTGLHFDDVRVLLQVFYRLVDAGHSVLVIEHNLDVMRCADWVIDLGPEAGDEGGRVVAQGTPSAVAASSESHTAQALREVLPAPIRASGRYPAPRFAQGKKKRV